MNPDLGKLHPYPFERLARLLAGVSPAADQHLIALSIGEPKHAPPRFVTDALVRHMDGLGAYPMAKGLAELRQAIARWCTRRFGLAPGALDPERHVLPVNGTREGLFAFAQAVIDRSQNPAVLMPNPFYQIYEGAALLAGAEPVYLDTTEENGFLPDFDAVPEGVWKRCQLLYVCSPGNPTGAVLDLAAFERLIELSDRHGFLIASDECYSEIHLDEASPPPGLLAACAKLGRDDFRNCVVFHSLSKRSNVPGLRSGFVAGDAKVMEHFRLYRTYHGCAVPVPTQLASVVAWDDDAHVAENRALYRAKFLAAKEILQPVMDVRMPAGAFYLWPRTPIDDETFARELYRTQHLTVLPGRYLSRANRGTDPGAGRVRISLVPGVDECAEACRRIRAFIETL